MYKCKLNKTILININIAIDLNISANKWILSQPLYG